MDCSGGASREVFVDATGSVHLFYCIRAPAGSYQLLALLFVDQSQAPKMYAATLALVPPGLRSGFFPLHAGATNRQDPLTKRSYNVRAQSSQVRRERSLRYLRVCAVYATVYSVLKKCGRVG